MCEIYLRQRHHHIHAPEIETNRGVKKLFFVENFANISNQINPRGYSRKWYTSSSTRANSIMKLPSQLSSLGVSFVFGCL